MNYVPPFTITDEILTLMAKSNLKSNQKSNQIILSAIRENPNITILELQEKTRLSESGVKRVIRQLKANSTIQRIGRTKGGHWEILKEEEV